MSKPFDKEEFLKNCCSCGCDRRGRELILEKIEMFEETEPEFSKQLIYYRDRLVRDDEDRNNYRKLRVQMGDNEKKIVADTLRAYADKLESSGPHFIIHCRLPKLPIFSGEDRIEAYAADIEVTMVAGPLGG